MCDSPRFMKGSDKDDAKQDPERGGPGKLAYNPPSCREKHIGSPHDGTSAFFPPGGISKECGV